MKFARLRQQRNQRGRSNKPENKISGAQMQRRGNKTRDMVRSFADNTTSKSVNCSDIATIMYYLNSFGRLLAGKQDTRVILAFKQIFDAHAPRRPDSLSQAQSQ